MLHAPALQAQAAYSAATAQVNEVKFQAQTSADAGDPAKLNSLSVTVCSTGRPAGVPRRVSSLSQHVGTFVEHAGGQRPIHSILVANNGIAAVKFVRSIRKWAFTTFGNEKAISLVAMATHDDIKANAEHIHMADQFVEVPSGPSANNYGNVKLIAETAVQAAVDAVWPGWCAHPAFSCLACESAQPHLVQTKHIVLTI